MSELFRPHVDAAAPFLQIDTIGGVCPVQAEGTVNGFPFYFRARHNCWTFSVDLDGNDPVDVSLGWKKGIHYENAWGETEDAAGYMPTETALHIIGQCAVTAWPTTEHRMGQVVNMAERGKGEQAAMRPQDIRVGVTYRNKGAGRTMRHVRRIGRDVVPHWFGSGAPPDEPGVEYVQFDAAMEPRFVDSLYLTSFARWAGREA